MGMLLFRHRMNALNKKAEKGAIDKVAPNSPVEKSIAPATTEKTDSKVADFSANYTKTEINRTATGELKKIAGSIGISDADSYTGAELKKMIISKLGL